MENKVVDNEEEDELRSWGVESMWAFWVKVLEFMDEGSRTMGFVLKNLTKLDQGFKSLASWDL